MTDLRKAAEMALEALDGLSEPYDVLKAQEALRQALAQPEQEPVGYWQGEYSEDGGATLYEVKQESAFGRTYKNIPLYTTPDSATRSADSAESFCKQELHNLMSVAGRMALELECLLLDTENLSVVSKWWDTGMEALQAYRHYVWSVTHGKDGENFCDTHCVHTDHHPDCKIGKQQALNKKADNARELGLDYELSKYSDIISSGGFEPPNKVDAQPEQEPVAWLWSYEGEPVNALMFKPYDKDEHFTKKGFSSKPLYTEPPKREWVGLTSEELASIVVDYAGHPTKQVAAIEAKLKEKNGY